MVTARGSKSVPAPKFKEGLDWVNTGGRSIRLAELRGRVVLLDFWTYGCINCRHVQPRLRELEDRFPDTLTVIGVHSGKFAHERRTPNLAAACDRQDVGHAVVNDRQYRVWRAYGVSAWPTFALIAPDGALLAVQPGEFTVERVAQMIESAIADGQTRGTLVRGPEPTVVPQRRAEGDLRFPGRALIEGERLVVSDTGHGRVLDCTLRVGSAGMAVAEVVSEHAGFVEPQGLAVLGASLLVADRAGQAVWRLGPNGDRERILGTGTLGEGVPSGGNGPDLAVRSPWGLVFHGGDLVVTMAGSHQLWRLNVDDARAYPWVGSGAEELIDGSLSKAPLAQPTGVTVYGPGVAFADCESSAIRLADESAGVRTVVGRGLFAFGDHDGLGTEVRLQHAEDVAGHAGVLCVADTYNGRLKRIDPVTQESRPWKGQAGVAGSTSEPAGVSSDGRTLVVADTGNHRVVLVDDDGSLTEIRFA
jgi:thiol-disulfide isomerase/thioredoxin